MIEILTTFESSNEVEIGRNFIINSGHAKFGENCRINRVIVGPRHGHDRRALVIGKNVGIGAEAKPLGQIRIDANAVMTIDYPIIPSRLESQQS